MLPSPVQEPRGLSAKDWLEAFPVKDIIREFVCPLCRQLLEEAHTFSSCGHTFCRPCVLSTLEGPGKTASQCPACHQPCWKKELIPHPHFQNIADLCKQWLTAGGTDLRAVLTDSQVDCAVLLTSSHDDSATRPEAHSEVRTRAQGTKRPAAVSSAAGKAPAKRHAPDSCTTAQLNAKETAHVRLPSAAPKVDAATPENPVKTMSDTHTHEQTAPNASSKAGRPSSRARANAAGNILADLAEQQSTRSSSDGVPFAAAKVKGRDKSNAQNSGQQSAGRRSDSRQTAAHAPSTAAGQSAATQEADGADQPKRRSSSPRVTVSPWRKKKQSSRQVHALPQRMTTKSAMKPPIQPRSRVHARARRPFNQRDTLPAHAPMPHAQAATRTAPEQQAQQHPSASPVPDDFVIQDSQDACDSPPPPPGRKFQQQDLSPGHQHQHEQQKWYNNRDNDSTTGGTPQSRVSDVQAGVGKAGSGQQRHVQLMPPPPSKTMPTASLAVHPHQDDQASARQPSTGTTTTLIPSESNTNPPRSSAKPPVNSMNPLGSGIGLPASATKPPGSGTTLDQLARAARQRRRTTTPSASRTHSPAAGDGVADGGTAAQGAARAQASMHMPPAPCPTSVHEGKAHGREIGKGGMEEGQVQVRMADTAHPEPLQRGMAGGQQYWEQAQSHPPMQDHQAASPVTVLTDLDEIADLCSDAWCGEAAGGPISSPGGAQAARQEIAEIEQAIAQADRLIRTREEDLNMAGLLEGTERTLGEIDLAMMNRGYRPDDSP